jgi:hypothetical protein
MSGNKFVPTKAADFNLWVAVLASYIEKNRERFNFPGDVWDALNALLEVWKEKYAVAVTPATRTSAAVLEKDEARTALEREVRRDVKEFLTYSRFVTDADRENMGLPVHKTTHTPAPKPTTVPEFRVDTSIIRRLTIHFQAAGSKTKAKPAGVHGAEVKWAILASPPTTVDDIIHSSFDTNSPLTLEFGEPERGKSVYLCLRWENTRGDKGPCSKIAMAIVP